MNLGSQPNLNKEDAFEVGNKVLPLGFCVLPIIIFTFGALVSVGCNVQWTCARVCELCKLVSEIVDCRI